MALTAVPTITNLTVPTAAADAAFAPGKLVLKVIYPVFSMPQTAMTGISDPPRAPPNVLISHQIPATGTMLDVGGTVTAILSGVTI
jgi:hypothetical protein